MRADMRQKVLMRTAMREKSVNEGRHEGQKWE